MLLTQHAGAWRSPAISPVCPRSRFDAAASSVWRGSIPTPLIQLGGRVMESCLQVSGAIRLKRALDRQRRRAESSRSTVATHRLNRNNERTLFMRKRGEEIYLAADEFGRELGGHMATLQSVVDGQIDYNQFPDPQNANPATEPNSQATASAARANHQLHEPIKNWPARPSEPGRI